MKRLLSALAAAVLAATLAAQAAFAANPPPAATPPAAAPAAPPPAAGPAPAAPGGGKQILVSLGQEKLYAYEDGKLVGDSVVTTGGPWTRTPLGAYSIIQKRTNFYMTSPWPEDDWRWYSPSWVNYALLFQASGYFIHDAPWRHNFGPGSNAQNGQAGGDFTGTHGCVNVPLQFERDLFGWADLGTPVTVVA